MAWLTRDEGRAVLFLAAVAVAGATLRMVREGPSRPPGAPLVAPHLPGQDIAKQAARSLRAEQLARPMEPGERVDVDRAPADELERLPGVGPALARRIVHDRDSAGPYGSLEELDRVPGVGPAMLRRLAPWVSFSGPRRPGRVLPSQEAKSTW